jgi:hypothetical protein
MAISKEEKFATEMADQLFGMRSEEISMNSNMVIDKNKSIPVSFLLAIMGSDAHIEAVKKKIHDSLLEDITEFSHEFKTDGDGNYCYDSDVYDYAYILDEYIEARYDDMIDVQNREAYKAKQDRLQINYRVVVSIERVEYDPESGSTEMHEESRSVVSISPELGIAEAVKWNLVKK